MATHSDTDKGAAPPPTASPSTSKKSQILSLHASGITGVREIAALAQSRPSYVASVLRGSGLLDGYFDLYSSGMPNIYAKYFRGKVGFRTPEAAATSVALIERLYQQFDQIGDRAGQHHAMIEALTLFNRARFSGKKQEADVFRAFLMKRLNDELH